MLRDGQLNPGLKWYIYLIISIVYGINIFANH